MSEKTEVREMRKRIKELTGKAPSSDDPRYLRDRIIELEERLANGEDIVHRAEPLITRTVSMTSSASSALDSILEREGKKRGSVTASKLVRTALAAWAQANGYKSEAAKFE